MNFVVIAVTCTIDSKNIRTVLLSLLIVSHSEYQHAHRLVPLSILLIGSLSEPKRGDVVYVTLTGYIICMYALRMLSYHVYGIYIYECCNVYVIIEFWDILRGTR